MRFIDIMLTIPTFFLILAVIAFIDPNIWSSSAIPGWIRESLRVILIDPNIMNIMIVIGLTSWMGVATCKGRSPFIKKKGNLSLQQGH